MRKDLINVIQLGAGFSLIFSAFNSQGLIEVSVLRNVAEKRPETGISGHSGYYSLSIIYLFFTIVNLFIPPIVKKLGAKWSQVIGAMGYLCFMLIFLYLNVYLLYIGSAILGAAAALLWAGNGVYLTQISRDNKLERNSGIMWSMLQSSLITGGIFLIYVLQSGDLYDSFTTIYIVFVFFTAIGICALLLLPNSTELTVFQNEEVGNDDEVLLLPDASEHVTEVSFCEQFYSILKMARSSKMMQLSVVFVYSGLEMTFYTGVFTSCLNATLVLKNTSKFIIPYSALAIGLGQIVGGIVTGSIKTFSRISTNFIISMAAFFHLLAFLLTFLALPSNSTLMPTDDFTYIYPSLGLMIFVSFLFGISDALWQTQIYVVIGTLFKKNPENAFAIFKFFQSLAASVSFFYSSFFVLPVQLGILSIGCFFTTFFFSMLSKNIAQNNTIIND